jgi:phosphonate transport system substrate-binding protein
MKTVQRSILLSLLLVLLFPSLLSASLQDPTTLVIGKVSHNPKKHYRYLKPIAEYVVERMRDLGVRRVKVLMAPDNRRMLEYLRQGRVDWVTETVMSASIFAEEAGAEILLRKWKKGVPVYHTIFFARNESGIASLDDLPGRRLALEDTGSTSSYYLPLSILIENGYRVEPLGSSRGVPQDARIGYLLAGDEINISTLVHKGLVDAGAFNNLDWDKPDHLPDIFQREMRIIHRSRSFPRAVELVRGDLDPALKARLRSLLLKAHEDPDAELPLFSYQRTLRFDPLRQDEMDAIRRLYRTVQLVEGRTR